MLPPEDATIISDASYCLSRNTMLIPFLIGSPKDTNDSWQETVPTWHEPSAVGKPDNTSYRHARLGDPKL